MHSTSLLGARERLEVHREFLREGDVGPAATLDLLEPEAMPRGRFDEALVQPFQRASAQREQQVRLVLEIDVQQRTRQPRLARNVVHGHVVDAIRGGYGHGSVEDVGAAPLLFLETSIGEIVHACRLARD
jgi:hypothetical protein